MDEFDNLDDLELNIDERTEDTKTKRYVQVFGWITFGLGIICLIVSFVRLVMMSFMNIFTGIVQHQNEAFDYINRFIAFQKTLAVVAIVLSALFILGGIGYALRREWGRKVYLTVCILGIGYHLFSGYITFFLMSEIGGDVNELGPFSPSFSSFTWLFTSLIPIAYLVINIILAGKSSTKAIMK